MSLRGDRALQNPEPANSPKAARDVLWESANPASSCSIIAPSRLRNTISTEDWGACGSGGRFEESTKRDRRETRAAICGTE
jgi:hypothetical protein